MENLNKAQKIFLIILGAIVLIVIFIYYITREDNTDYAEIDNIYIENETIGENIDEEEIIIHVVGEVNKEGIVNLKNGDRISDAIEKAGGATENADLSKINLAYKVEDGQKINIPNKNEENTNNEYITTDSGEGIVETEETIQEDGEQININTASQTQLETLPGIGPSTALKIIQYREENGKFNSIEDIKNVNGIGDAKFESIKDYIIVK